MQHCKRRRVGSKGLVDNGSWGTSTPYPSTRWGHTGPLRGGVVGAGFWCRFTANCEISGLTGEGYAPQNPLRLCDAPCLCPPQKTCFAGPPTRSLKTRGISVADLGQTHPQTPSIAIHEIVQSCLTSLSPDPVYQNPVRLSSEVKPGAHLAASVRILHSLPCWG